MQSNPTLPTIALIVITTIGLAACVAVNEAVTDRDLICEGTEDDICVRIADLAVSEESDLEMDVGALRTVVIQVAPTDCAAIGREQTSTRCWRVKGEGIVDITIENGATTNGFGRWVYERSDGTLGVEGS